MIFPYVSLQLTFSSLSDCNSCCHQFYFCICTETKAQKWHKSRFFDYFLDDLHNFYTLFNRVLKNKNSILLLFFVNVCLHYVLPFCASPPTLKSIKKI